MRAGSCARGEFGPRNLKPKQPWDCQTQIVLLPSSSGGGGGKSPLSNASFFFIQLSMLVVGGTTASRGVLIHTVTHSLAPRSYTSYKQPAAAFVNPITHPCPLRPTGVCASAQPPYRPPQMLPKMTSRPTLE